MPDYVTPGPCPSRSPSMARPMRLAIALSAGLLAPIVAVGQAQIPVQQQEKGDGPTQRSPRDDDPQRPQFYTLDTILNPKRPELGSTTLIAEVVAHEFLDLMSAEAYIKAEESALTLVALAPESPLSHYNHACVLARRGKVDASLTALEESIDLGWRRNVHIALDPDLDNLRTDARFDALIEKLNALIDAEKITPRPLRADSWRDVATQLESRVPSILQRYHVPGASIALIRDGETVWSGAFGTLDLRTNDPVNQHALFKVVGPSRLFTAIVALELQERGVWNLDDPLVEWFPDIVLPAGVDPQSLTIRRVLNYTAGLTIDEWPFLFESVDDEIRRTFQVSPDRFGVKYTYTPRSYMAIGRAIEKAISPRGSADTLGHEEMDGFYPNRVQGGVLRPLRMARTLARRPSGSRFDLAVGHTEYGTPYRDVITPLRPGSPYYTTAGDLAKLVEFLMGSLNDVPRSPLSARSLAQMVETGLPGDDGFGLGVRVRETEFGRYVELIDVRYGVGSLLRWYPETGSGVVVLFNSATGSAAAERIAHLALGGI